MLSTAFRNELASRETQFRVEISTAHASKSADAFLVAPDKYYASAVLMQQSLLIGSGHRSQIIASIRKSKGCPALKDKLILLQRIKYLGQKLFKDDYKKVDMDTLKIRRREIFQLWLNLVK